MKQSTIKFIDTTLLGVAIGMIIAVAILALIPMNQMTEFKKFQSENLIIPNSSIIPEQECWNENVSVSTCHNETYYYVFGYTEITLGSFEYKTIHFSSNLDYIQNLSELIIDNAIIRNTNCHYSDLYDSLCREKIFSTTKLKFEIFSGRLIPDNLLRCEVTFFDSEWNELYSDTLIFDFIMPKIENYTSKLKIRYLDAMEYRIENNNLNYDVTIQIPDEIIQKTLCDYNIVTNVTVNKCQPKPIKECVEWNYGNLLPLCNSTYCCSGSTQDPVECYEKICTKYKYNFEVKE